MIDKQISAIEDSRVNNKSFFDNSKVRDQSYKTQNVVKLPKNVLFCIMLDWLLIRKIPEFFTNALAYPCKIKEKKLCKFYRIGSREFCVCYYFAVGHFYVENVVKIFPVLTPARPIWKRNSGQ